MVNCTIEGLYNSFRGKLKGFIAARTKDEALAEDLVQDTFVKLADYCGRGGSCTYPKSLLLFLAFVELTGHLGEKADGCDSH